MILPSGSDVLEYSSAKEKCRRHAALLQRAAAAAFLELTISIASDTFTNFNLLGPCHKLPGRARSAAWEPKSRLCLQRADLDGIAEVLQPCDKTVGVLGFGAPIKVVVTEINVAGSIAKHMIDGGEH